MTTPGGPKGESDKGSRSNDAAAEPSSMMAAGQAYVEMAKEVYSDLKREGLFPGSGQNNSLPKEFGNSFAIIKDSDNKEGSSNTADRSSKESSDLKQDPSAIELMGSEERANISERMQKTADHLLSAPQDASDYAGHQFPKGGRDQEIAPSSKQIQNEYKEKRDLANQLKDLAKTDYPYAEPEFWKQAEKHIDKKDLTDFQRYVADVPKLSALEFQRTRELERANASQSSSTESSRSQGSDNTAAQTPDKPLNRTNKNTNKLMEEFADKFLELVKDIEPLQLKKK